MSLFHSFPVFPPTRLSHLALPLAALLLAGGVTPLAARDSLFAATPAPASAGTLVSLTDPVSGRSIQVRLADHRIVTPPAGHARATGNVQAAPARAHLSVSCPVTRGCGLRAPAPVMDP